MEIKGMLALIALFHVSFTWTYYHFNIHLIQDKALRLIAAIECLNTGPRCYTSITAELLIKWNRKLIKCGSDVTTKRLT